MKRSGGKKLPLWVVLALTSAFIVTLLIGSIVFAYRHFLQKGYNSSLREELEEGLSDLKNSGFSSETADMLTESGMRVLLMRQSDGEVLYFSHPDTGPEEEGTHGGRAGKSGRAVRRLIEQTLGSGDGSFFSDGRDPEDAKGTPDNRDVFLMGRSGDVLYSLNLPMDFSNVVLGLAVRYAAVIGLIGLVISIFVFYLVSRAVTWPHKQIAGISAKIAEMDFSQKCPLSPVRELNELSESVNTMSDRLQETVGELQEANARLKQDLEDRQKEQRLMTDLISNLSHDLKTPIAVISGYAEGLQDGVARTPEQQARYCEMIQRESDHMLSIVREMLAVTRLESGAIPVRETDFDLSALLDDVLDLGERELERRDLQVERLYPPSLPVRSDYDRIRQCVVNYALNAVSHINGGTRIRVRTEDLRDRIRLCVENSSAPIPEEEIPLLWEKLYRGDPARQPSKGGAGLGLCIVKGNMELLGQEYGFQNLPKEGMVRFWLCVPKAE